jgi:hypothetical protein
MATWQLASIMSLKKDAYYTNNVSSSKGGMMSQPHFEGV